MGVPRQTDSATNTPSSAIASASPIASAPPAESAATAQGAGEGAAASEASRSTPTTLDGLRVSCLMNAKYHATREACLDGRHRWLMFLVIFFGAGAVVDLTNLWSPLQWTRPLFAAVAATMGALDLTFDLSNRARAHALMKRRYFELLADVTEGRKSIAEAQTCLVRYSADEEPVFQVVLKAAWKEAQESVYGDEGLAYAIPKWDLRLKNIRRFDGKNYLLRKSAPD